MRAFSVAWDIFMSAVEAIGVRKHGGRARRNWRFDQRRMVGHRPAHLEEPDHDVNPQTREKTNIGLVIRSIGLTGTCACC